MDPAHHGDCCFRLDRSSVVDFDVQACNTNTHDHEHAPDNLMTMTMTIKTTIFCFFAFFLLIIPASGPRRWPAEVLLADIVDKLAQSVNAIEEDTKVIAENTQPVLPGWATAAIAVVGFLVLFWARISVVWGRLVARASRIEAGQIVCISWIYWCITSFDSALQVFSFGPSSRELEARQLLEEARNNAQEARDDAQEAHRRTEDLQRELENLQREFENLQRDYDGVQAENRQLQGQLNARNGMVFVRGFAPFRVVENTFGWVRNMIFAP